MRCIVNTQGALREVLFQTVQQSERSSQCYFSHLGLAWLVQFLLKSHKCEPHCKASNT